MADSNKAKRYGKSPKIKPTASTGPVTETPPTTGGTGAAPAADVMAGTDGIPVQERQATERMAMFDGHTAEMKDMHKRHAKALEEMGTRHLGELGMTPGEKGKK